MFAQALPIAKSFRSPRASAFTLLGLDAYCAVVPDDRRARDTRRVLADRLMLCLESVETPDWIWFEESLGLKDLGDRIDLIDIYTNTLEGVRQHILEEATPWLAA